jgi:carbon-monoxide dehydrogenase iron sulfur subunit
MRIHIEKNSCSGCRLCEQLCAITHFKEINPKKSAIKIEAKFPVPGTFTPTLCDQCGECESICPAEAIQLKNGAYVIDPELCTMCEACVDECPKGAVHIREGVDHPIKCDLCMKCTEVCNTGAIVAMHSAPVGKEQLKCMGSVVRLSA